MENDGSDGLLGAEFVFWETFLQTWKQNKQNTHTQNVLWLSIALRALTRCGATNNLFISIATTTKNRREKNEKKKRKKLKKKKKKGGKKK